MRTLLTLLGVFLLTQGVEAQEVYVDNVVIVLDASGSMNDNMKGTSTRKINAAKMAIKEVMKTIPRNTQVGLLVFGGKANGWVYPLRARDDTTLFHAVDGLSAGGGTPLGAYMKQGADRLLAARELQYGYGSYRLLVVTDGEANDAALVEAYTPDIVARGIITDVIGVDMAKAHTLATKVHSYRRANDPTALKKAIQEVFAEVGKTSDGQSGEDAFEELAGLPDEIAMTIVSALASSGNHPIGGSPGDSAAGGVTQTGKPSAGAQAQPQATQARGGRFSWIITIAVVVAILVVVSKNKRGRR